MILGAQIRNMCFRTQMNSRIFQEMNKSSRHYTWKGESIKSSRICIEALSQLLRGTSRQAIRSRVVCVCGRAARHFSRNLKKLEHKMCTFMYSENSLQSLAIGFARKHFSVRRGNYVLFGGACFAWDREKISDNQLERCLDDVELIDILCSEEDDHPRQLESWEKVMANPDMKVWRRQLDDLYLYEYKVFGSFSDCTAKSFYKVQLDLDFRKVWDKHVIETDVIDHDKESGSEVVYWSTYFPYPMSSRDYVFTRRSKIFHRHRVMAIVSQATSHPRRPISKKFVRVKRYSSRMVIKPFTSFDEFGFNYVLTYHDDPQAPIPTAAVSWMTKTGVPAFVNQLHNAAVLLDSQSGTNFKDLQSDDQFSTTSSSSYI